jgi:hypothetical protein
LACKKRIARSGLYLLAFLFRANKLALPKVDSDLELAELQPPGVEKIWDGRWDDEDVDSLFQPSEKLIAVPYTWMQEFFIDAKMPNEKGAIPLGGAYYNNCP